MPELPEVETIRSGLAARAVGRRIVGVRVGKSKIIRGSTRSFIAYLRGKSFSDVARHGKLLIFPITDTDRFLLIHLKMTGQLIYQDVTHSIAGGHQWPPVDRKHLPNAYTHVQIDFADTSQLFFNDLRQFGYMELVSGKQLRDRVAAMGVDPIQQELTLEAFSHMLAGRKTSIKAVLLNQSLIAGIGNIYADEICFRAHVRPARAISRLTKKEKKALWQAIPRVLTYAIAHGGTTFRNYTDSDGKKGNFTRLLKVYGREGKACRRCKQGVIKKTKIAGRGTHFCPVCQI